MVVVFDCCSSVIVRSSVSTKALYPASTIRGDLLNNE